MSYYSTELPSHVSGKRLRRHLSSLLRSGVHTIQISAVSGVADVVIDTIIEDRPAQVPFSVADPLYNVVPADKPLDTLVDGTKAWHILNTVAERRDCSLEEAGVALKLPPDTVKSLLCRGDLTLRDWQTMAERSKKLGVRVSAT